MSKKKKTKSAPNTGKVIMSSIVGHAMTADVHSLDGKYLGKLTMRLPVPEGVSSDEIYKAQQAWGHLQPGLRAGWIRFWRNAPLFNLRKLLR